MPSDFTRTSRSLAADDSAASLWTWLIAGVFLAAWLAWFFFAELTIYEVSKQARLEVEQTAHPLASPLAGRVVAVELHLNQSVEQAQVLVELDSSSEKLRLREEESRLQALPPQIDAVSRQISAREAAREKDRQASQAAVVAARSRRSEADTAARFAREQDQRVQTLNDRGYLPKLDALRAHAESEKLSAAVNAQQATIHELEMDAQTRDRQADVDIADLKRTAASLQGQRITTEATIARLKQDIDRHAIRAPISGRVGDALPLQAGAYVGEGEKLATIVPEGRLRIVADFPPPSVLGRIQPGQRARLRLDGFPWAQYGMIGATVSHVASEIRDDRVRIEFTPDSRTAPAILMRHGLPGSIEVDVEQVSPAVLILRAAGQAWSRSMPPTTGAAQ